MNVLSKIFKKKSNKMSLILNPKGINSIGGKASSDISIPKLETSPIIYFGCISKNEDQLPSIDFDLHLVCPLFIDLQSPIFFDYSDPKRPQLIRNNVPSNFAQLFDDIPNNASIEYKQMNFCFDTTPSVKMKIGVHDIDVIPGEIGHSGVPNWIQEENWPNCPVSGKKMEFLFQLGDIEDCETINGQDILDKEFIDPYLHFGHGYLYIFHEPTSNTVAYLNQV